MKKPYGAHIPGMPKEDEPPKALYEIADRVRHPLVRQTGITCTEKGEWALYVTVPREAVVPVLDLESQCGGFPVVYEEEPDGPLRPL